MVIWKLLNNDIAEEIWDQHLAEFSDFTFYQTYAWGEHRRSSGWIPYRWVAYNNGEIVAMVQGVFRSYKFGMGALWSSGGPVGDISVCGIDFLEAVLKSTTARHLYYRLFSNRRGTETDQTLLKSLGWRKCNFKLRSGLSMRLRLDKDIEEIREGLSRNWRRNLKRSKKHNLTVRHWPNPDIDEVLSVYDAMQKYKGISEQFSQRELESMFEKFGNQIVILKCDDAERQLIALRGCIFLGRYAWDVFAATTPAARKLSASHALLWELLMYLREMGIKEYDLMGMDPVKNPGVTSFKKGTGGEPIEYLGEWDWATNGMIRLAANIGIRRIRGND